MSTCGCDAGTTCSVLRQSVRWGSKKTYHNTRGKRRGWKKYEDDYVEAGMIIFRQFGIKVYPGENVRSVCILSSIWFELSYNTLVSFC